MLFQLEWSDEEGSIYLKCAVPGIIKVPNRLKQALSASWLIIVQKDEWWCLNNQELRGPLGRDENMGSLVSVSWTGPSHLEPDATDITRREPGPPAQSEWGIAGHGVSKWFSKAIVVGRSKHAHVTPKSPLVSKIHGMLMPYENHVTYYDLSSSNGSFDGHGSRVRTMHLHHEQSVRLGDQLLTINKSEPRKHAAHASLSSPSMAHVESLITKIAPSDAPVVISGESGVGKEGAAQAIHHRSGRKGKLVTANAACFTEQLARSELFGHRVGAFTGATANRDGLFLAAHEGTLFLDEIAEMPLSVQAELLRAIETGTIHPLGTCTTVIAKPRLVVATHRNLAAEVAQGRFREDLYYRLHVVEVNIPPLRERAQDIEELAQQFVNEFCPGFPLKPDAIRWLKVQPWRGNIRELRNLFWKTSVLYPQRPTELFNLRYTANGENNPHNSTEDVVRVYFETGQDVQTTADALGLHRSTVHRRLKQHRNQQAQAA